MINKGADVNSFTSHGWGTINWAIFRVQQIILRRDSYIESQNEVRKKLAMILDLLIKNNADLNAWANRGYYPEPNPGPASKTILLDPEDPQNGLNLEKIKPLREFIQEYFNRKNISFVL